MMNEANENMNHENDKVTIDEKNHILIVKKHQLFVLLPS